MWTASKRQTLRGIKIENLCKRKTITIGSPFTARAEATVMVIQILWWNFNYSNKKRMMIPIISLLIVNIYLLTLHIFREVSILFSQPAWSYPEKKVCVIQQDTLLMWIHIFFFFFFPISHWRKILHSVLLMSFRYWWLWTVAFLMSLFKL